MKRFSPIYSLVIGVAVILIGLILVAKQTYAENIPTTAEQCVCSRLGGNSFGPTQAGRSTVGCGNITYNNSSYTCKTGELCVTGTDPNANLCQPNPLTLISKSCDCTHSGDTSFGQNGLTCQLVWYNNKTGAKTTETQVDDGVIGGEGHCSGGTSCQHVNTTTLVNNDPVCKSPCTSQTSQVCKAVAGCQCNNPGLVGSNNNTKQCGLKSCANFEYCVNGTSGAAPKCQAATCTCEHSGTSGSGNNWFDCYDQGFNANSANVDSHKTHESCNGNDTCNQQGTSITCVSTTARLTPPAFATFNPCGTPDKTGKAICNTAIGAISTDPAGFISSLFKFILGISGMIAVGVIVYSGLLLLTSQGNPEKMQGARETITAAIVGIIFIVFSMVILQTIGVDILGLPGFGK